jgi:hypothetical protein
MQMVLTAVPTTFKKGCAKQLKKIKNIIYFLFLPEGLAQPLQRLFFIFSSILPNLFLEGFAALF